MTRTTTLIFAVASGIAVANLYYIQPVLELIARDFHASPSAVGTISLLMQFGYAAGILFFVPLGDVLERRGMSVALFAAATASLAGCALAPNVAVLAACGLLTGALTIVAQVLMPFAADLAAPAQRGRVVASVQTGLIIGIVFSRGAGGLIGAHFGWRSVFWFGVAVTALATLALARALPLRTPHATLRYPELLKSVFVLTVRYPALRASMGLGFFAVATFSGFWTTIAFHMHDLGYGADVVGSLGAMALVGAIFAVYFGSLIDRRGTLFTGTMSIVALALAFAIFLGGAKSIVALYAGMICFPIGMQLNQISNQSRIFALDPQARSRLNTAYMFVTFTGGAIGAFAGAASWQAGGWNLMCAVCLGQIACGALILAWLRFRISAGPAARTSDATASGSPASS